MFKNYNKKNREFIDLWLLNLVGSAHFGAHVTSDNFEPRKNSVQKVFISLLIFWNFLIIERKVINVFVISYICKKKIKYWMTSNHLSIYPHFKYVADGIKDDFATRTV